MIIEEALRTYQKILELFQAPREYKLVPASAHGATLSEGYQNALKYFADQGWKVHSVDWENDRILFERPKIHEIKNE